MNENKLLLNSMKKFLDFIREQGVVGLAVGFIMGGSVSKLVTSLVNDIINPVLGIVLGLAGNMSEKTFRIAGAEVYWGRFINSMIDFAVIAIVVYVGVKVLGLDKLDKKRDPAAPKLSVKIEGKKEKEK